MKPKFARWLQIGCVDNSGTLNSHWIQGQL